MLAFTGRCTLANMVLTATGECPFKFLFLTTAVSASHCLRDLRMRAEQSQEKLRAWNSYVNVVEGGVSNNQTDIQSINQPPQNIHSNNQSNNRINNCQSQQNMTSNQPEEVCLLVVKNLPGDVSPDNVERLFGLNLLQTDRDKVKIILGKETTSTRMVYLTVPRYVSVNILKFNGNMLSKRKIIVKVIDRCWFRTDCQRKVCRFWHPEKFPANNMADSRPDTSTCDVRCPQDKSEISAQQVICPTTEIRLNTDNYQQVSNSNEYQKRSNNNNYQHLLKTNLRTENMHQYAPYLMETSGYQADLTMDIHQLKMLPSGHGNLGALGVTKEQHIRTEQHIHTAPKNQWSRPVQEFRGEREFRRY